LVVYDIIHNEWQKSLSVQKKSPLPITRTLHESIKGGEFLKLEGGLKLFIFITVPAAI